MREWRILLTEADGTGRSSIPERVMRFARLLRSRGFKVFPSAVTDALRALDHIDLFRREDFFSALRAALVSTDLEWSLFPECFDLFWLRGDEEEKQKGGADPAERTAAQKVLGEEVPVPDCKGERIAPAGESREKDFLEGVSYSPVSAVEKRDLSRFDNGDIPVAQLILKNLLSPFRVESSRRFRRSRRAGDMDFRRIMKKGLRSEGLPLTLFFKRRKRRLKRLVLLADVSGSMDRYARFVMPFLLGMKGIGSRAEVFVFSTSLTPVTPFLRRHGLDEVLEIIARKVPDWSGGTRIGYSLHQFNQWHGKRHLNRRKVVVILSDGWDLGARNLLLREVQALSSRVHSLIWLNPLAGDPEYRPLFGAMERLLPYLDYLLPADSLQSLKRVGKTLARVMAS